MREHSEKSPLHSSEGSWKGMYTNARLKVYPSLTKFQVSNRMLFRTGKRPPSYKRSKRRPNGMEKSYEPGNKKKKPDKAINSPNDKSRRRAKTAVTDIAMCNRFDYMFTWTLDPKKVDRKDPSAVYRYVRAALSNMSARKGFKYIAIPEYHRLKPGEKQPGIHIHGLCMLGTVKIKPSMKRGKQRTDKKGRPIFNMVDWPYGWSTVVKLDGDYLKAVSYVAKYITKQRDKIFGKYYLSSRDLKKTPDIYPLDGTVDYQEYRDPDKLASGQQYETNIYNDTFIITEVVEQNNGSDAEQRCGESVP